PQHPGRMRTLRFHRDPRDISRIYFFDPRQQRYAAVPYRHLGRPALSIWELREAHRAVLAAGQAEVNEEALFTAYTRLHQQQQDAAQLTKQARKNRQRKRHMATNPDADAASSASLPASAFGEDAGGH